MLRFVAAAQASEGAVPHEAGAAAELPAPRSAYSTKCLLRK
jgi:hypothetical protein